MPNPRGGGLLPPDNGIGDLSPGEVIDSFWEGSCYVEIIRPFPIRPIRGDPRGSQAQGRITIIQVTCEDGATSRYQCSEGRGGDPPQCILLRGPQTPGFELPEIGDIEAPGRPIIGMPGAGTGGGVGGAIGGILGVAGEVALRPLTHPWWVQSCINTYNGYIQQGVDCANGLQAVKDGLAGLGRRLRKRCEFMSPSCYDDMQQALANMGNAQTQVQNWINEVNQGIDVALINRDGCTSGSSPGYTPKPAAIAACPAHLTEAQSTLAAWQGWVDQFERDCPCTGPYAI